MIGDLVVDKEAEELLEEQDIISEDDDKPKEEEKVDLDRNIKHEEN